MLQTQPAKIEVLCM